MSIEKVTRAPSIQHLVKMIGGTPDQTARNIIRMRDDGPKIRNFEARHYHMSRLKGMSLEQALRQAALDRRKEVAQTAIETLPLLEEYIRLSSPRWFRETGEYLHLISPGIVLPIKALGLIGAGGFKKLLCLQLWKTTSLSPTQFNIWASFCKVAVLERDPDVEDFDWLEMSVPVGTKARELRVRSLEAARLLSAAELKEVHDHLQAAMLIVEGTPKAERSSKKEEPKPPSFFDDDDKDE